MRILLVHNYYKKNLIGGEDLVFQRELNSLKVLLGSENVVEYTVSNDDLRFSSMLKNIFYSREHAKEITKIIIEKKIDILHCHNFFPLLSTSIFLAAKKQNVKIIHTLHNYRFWCIGERLFRNNTACEKCVKKRFNSYGVLYGCFRGSRIQSLVFSLAFYWYKINGSFDSINKFFVLTEFQRKKIISFGVDSDKVILKPNFNVTALDILPSFNNKDGYIFVGRLEKEKGVELLVNTFNRLPKGFNLTIIGDGPMREWVLENLGNNITYLGTQSNQVVLKLISRSKYLIQSSLSYETFGLTIIEAFSKGTPVIGFNVGTRSDFIKNHHNGFIVDRTEDLDNIIIESKQYDQYDQMCLNAYKFSKNFDEVSVMSKQVELYKQIMKSE